jgi:hypothetical protein
MCVCASLGPLRFHLLRVRIPRIIDQLKHLGLRAGCYKVILDCAEKNVGFYEKLGFVRKEVQMAHYYQAALAPTPAPTPAAADPARVL